jgi:hypothetical protein
MPSLDWKSFFATREDNEAGNKTTTVFTEAWLPQTSIAHHFQTITVDPNMAVFVADLSKMLQVLHSFKNAGGSLLRPDNKLMCLFSTGASAIAIQVNDTTFMAD